MSSSECVLRAWNCLRPRPTCCGPAYTDLDGILERESGDLGRVVVTAFGKKLDAESFLSLAKAGFESADIAPFGSDELSTNDCFFTGNGGVERGGVLVQFRTH